MTLRYLLVVSDLDPVARAVAERWGTPPALGEHVDGVAVRGLGPGVGVLRRPGRHIHDEHLDERIPSGVRSEETVLVFPSIHRSQSGERCMTVHPLGNPGPRAEFGGAPGHLVRAPARLMADALRRLHELSPRSELPVTFEATHHGPALGLPACFVEIALGESQTPPDSAVNSLAETLPQLTEDPRDQVAVGVGGGHYAPHFTDLAIRRCWAFGHILSRHALTETTAEVARNAGTLTPGSRGFLYARAADQMLPVCRGLEPRLSEKAAPRRAAPGAPS